MQHSGLPQQLLVCSFSYEEVADKEDCGYQDMFLSYLERLVRDLDKKVDRGKDRLRRSAQAKQQVCNKPFLGDIDLFLF